MIVLLAVKMPYIISYDNYRAIVNESIILMIIGIYTFYGSFVDYNMHYEPFNEIIPYIIAALLILCILSNFGLILAIIFKKIRDRIAYEEDQKIIRIYNQDLEMNKELGRRVVGLTINRSNVKHRFIHTSNRNLEQSLLVDKSLEMVRKDLSRVISRNQMIEAEMKPEGNQ